MRIQSLIFSTLVSAGVVACASRFRADGPGEDAAPLASSRAALVGDGGSSGQGSGCDAGTVVGIQTDAGRLYFNPSSVKIGVGGTLVLQNQTGRGLCVGVSGKHPIFRHDPTEDAGVLISALLGSSQCAAWTIKPDAGLGNNSMWTFPTEGGNPPCPPDGGDFLQGTTTGTLDVTGRGQDPGPG